MEISYWKSRWRKNKTGWHVDGVYPQLPELWPQLHLPGGARVLVPLCGKSHDIDWLVAQGFQVVGVEAASEALASVMDRSAEPFVRTDSYGYTVFQSKSMELWQGNFLNFPAAAIESIDAIYDKASIVALPAAMRAIYARKLLEFADTHTQILLQSFEYEQQEMNGPPFSVLEQEIKELLGGRFNITPVYNQSKFEEVKKFRQRGLSSYFIEKVYHLRPNEQI